MHTIAYLYRTAHIIIQNGSLAEGDRIRNALAHFPHPLPDYPACLQSCTRFFPELCSKRY